MAIDWEAKTGAPLVALFGEPATFTPASGAPAFGVVGVFDNQFRSTVILDTSESSTSDLLPVFGVNALQFIPSIAVPTKLPPVQNDKITFPAGTQPHSGKSYLVVEPRPDNHGVFHLALNERAAP